MPETKKVVEDPNAEVVNPLEDEKVKGLVEELLNKQKEEFKKLLDDEKKKIANTEKSKLYDTLEQHKKSELELKGKLSAYEKDEQSKKQAEEEKRKEDMDLKERLAEHEIEVEKIKNRSAEMIKAVEDGYKKELNARDLDIHKQSLIASANGRIIPEMVSGSTKEEIEDSVEKAKKKYESILEAREEEVKTKQTKDGVVPGPNGLDKGDSLGVETGDYYSVLNMSDEEYARHKETQLQKYLK